MLAVELVTAEEMRQMVALHHRGATPSGALDSDDTAWMIVDRGSGDPNPLTNARPAHYERKSSLPSSGQTRC